jgi:5'-methylthioadenosine phosphorylase
MVTDFDCWHDDYADVDVASLIATLMGNAGKGKDTVRHLVKALSNMERTPSPQAIETNLDVAIITAPQNRDPARVAMLDAVAGRAL